jgi:hypothetical protein
VLGLLARAQFFGGALHELGSQLSGERLWTSLKRRSARSIAPSAAYEFLLLNRNKLGA